jgi:tetratricopeptide (TPR) repeat protein
LKRSVLLVPILSSFLLLPAAVICGGCGRAISPQVMKGMVATSNRQWGEAVTLLSQAAEADPSKDDVDFFYLYSNRALAYSRVGMHELALKDADLLVQGAPKFSHSFFIRGEVLSRLGRHEAALADCDQGLKLNHPRIKFSTARPKVLLRAGRTAEGLALANEIIRMSNADPYTCFNLAETMDEVGLNIEALAAYKTALEIKDDSGRLVSGAITGGLLGYLQAKSARTAKLPEAWAAFARQRIAALEEDLGKESLP